MWLQTVFHFIDEDNTSLSSFVLNARHQQPGGASSVRAKREIAFI
ncbi:MAG: hypothetical protein ACJA1F_002723 [Paracoccaceae bacterium]